VTTSTPHTFQTWLQLIFTCSRDWNEYWRDGAFVRLLTSIRMRRKSWKVFHRIASRNVSYTFTTVDRSVLLHNGTLLKETWPKLLNTFVFLRNKVIPWNAWSYHLQNDPEKVGGGGYFHFKAIPRPLIERFTPVSARRFRQFKNFI
jgi:hypothetical protein